MSRLLMACTPAQGHANPLVAMAGHLVGRGHEVVFTTTGHYRAKVEATGARFVPLPAGADAHNLMVANPDREGAGSRGVAGLKDDIRRIFVDPAPVQYAELRRILADFPADVLVADATYVGAAAFLLLPRSERPPFVAVGVMPLSVSSGDTAPFGTALAPMVGPLGQLRNAVLNWAVPHLVLADVVAHSRRVLAEHGLPGFTGQLFDVPAQRADAYLQASVAGFEYPRRDLPAGVRFIGPVLAPAPPDTDLPSWWADLDHRRPVVHVTQGTLDNADLGRLLAPTLAGLAGHDVLVVATTGGPDPHRVPGPVPANARIERFVPHARLLPRVDVMVTNGGFGGVQQALAHGVPMVVAGDSEDKPEVAARVAWSGSGINLWTGRPGARAVAAAVHRVLADPRFAARARGLQAEIAAHRPLEEAAAVIEGLAG